MKLQQCVCYATLARSLSIYKKGLIEDTLPIYYPLSDACQDSLHWLPSSHYKCISVMQSHGCISCHYQQQWIHCNHIVKGNDVHRVQPRM